MKLSNCLHSVWRVNRDRVRHVPTWNVQLAQRVGDFTALVLRFGSYAYLIPPATQGPRVPCQTEGCPWVVDANLSNGSCQVPQVVGSDLSYGSLPDAASCQWESGLTPGGRTVPQKEAEVKAGKQAIRPGRPHPHKTQTEANALQSVAANTSV
ncbi:hypothetical protein P7K49_007250 [Saguinus oedipus]|uniref:Uncharacterized protein n=1 Tax=Saguinus oedipus TaxID=9490 RepID=A0ABQ9VUC5_SAGOE|nr:hypothetical protein P7K49_007250 [Saguinus oedipus]